MCPILFIHSLRQKEPWPGAQHHLLTMLSAAGTLGQGFASWPDVQKDDLCPVDRFC